MPINSDSIVIDTSCLILLSKINEINLVKLPERDVLTTPQVIKEFIKPLPDWIEVSEPPKDKVDKILRMNLDRGEASAIALAMSIEQSVLIIDDLKGRKIAQKLNIRYSGTLGLILQAKKEGILSSVKPIIKKIENTDFRIDKKLLQTILDEAGE